MVLEGPWRDQFSRDISSNQVASLRLSRSMGWRSEDLSFLMHLPELRGLEIYDMSVRDISPMLKIRALEHIGLECDQQLPLNFTEFGSLTHCYLRWAPSMKSIVDVTSMRRLNLVNAPFQDLRDLSPMTDLQSLKLTSRKTSSLEGIDRFDELTTLDLYACSALKELEPLATCCDELLTVSFDSCRQVDRIDILAGKQKLESLTLNNCGRIESLSPLENCDRLKHLFFTGDTKIADGDLSVLEKLPALKNVRFANRRHYSHKRADFSRSTIE